MVYLNGGLACDLDVWAKPGIRQLLERVKDRLLLLFEETHRVGTTIGHLAIYLGLTEMPRYPQYRAGIFAAIKGHVALLAALDLLAQRVLSGSYAYEAEPFQSLVLTGPGLFTDAVGAWATTELQTATVSRWESMRDHYGHGGMGTWKTYESAESSNLATLAAVLATMVFGWYKRLCLARLASRSIARGVKVLATFPPIFWLCIVLAAMLTLDRFCRVPYGFLAWNSITGTPPHQTPPKPCGWDYEANWTIHMVEGSPLAGFGDGIQKGEASRTVLTCSGVRGVTASFVADPMGIIPAEQPGLYEALPVDKQDQWFLFYEAKDLVAHRGVIAVSTSIDEGKSWIGQGVVLRESIHLSYPLVKFHAASGMILMIPETNEAEAVSLYATSPEKFPFGWYLVKRPLLGSPFADTSPVRFNGMWYIYTWCHWRLRLYYTEDLLWGRWTLHPSFSLDSTRESRPAGPPVVRDGKLLRYAQDCSVKYGERVHIFQVDEISQTRYRERLIGTVEPSFISGRPGGNLHHVDAHRLPDGREFMFVDADVHGINSAFWRRELWFVRLKCAIALLAALNVVNMLVQARREGRWVGLPQTSRVERRQD